MQDVWFRVEGSAAEPYKVQFIRRDTGEVEAYCSCRAGESGQYCKHRFSIMKGAASGVVGDNRAQVELVRSWLPGTQLMAAWDSVHEAEEQMDAAKKELSKVKKTLAKVMRGL